MTTENRPDEGSVPITNPPGQLDLDAPDMPDSKVLIDPVALKQGHEPDTVNLRSVLYVPIALVLTFILTYTLVTIVVYFTRGGGPDRAANEIAAKRNQAEINERVRNLQKSGQPPLEAVQQFKSDPSVQPNDPAYMRSRVPTEDGNSPHYHPEDMRPSSELGKKLGLQDYAWIDKTKGVVRLPVEEAIKVVAGQTGTGKPFLAVQQKDGKPVQLKDLMPAKPTPSNPHWTGPSPAKHDPHEGHNHPMGKKH